MEWLQKGTITRRMDGLLQRSPAGSPAYPQAERRKPGDARPVRTALCSAGIKWVWHSESKQCVGLAGSTAVRRQPRERVCQLWSGADSDQLQQAPNEEGN